MARVHVFPQGETRKLSEYHNVYRDDVQGYQWVRMGTTIRNLTIPESLHKDPTERHVHDTPYHFECQSGDGQWWPCRASERPSFH